MRKMGTTEPKTTTLVTNRNSNLELFRIITMLLIVAHHYVVNSGLNELIYQNILAPNSIFLLILGAWGKVGINCFILITGYFMCLSNISITKFLKLIFEIEFYNIAIYIIFVSTGYTNFSLVEFAKTLLPFTSISQNFTGCYLVFYLCIPFLNILISNINQQKHLQLITITSFIYIILGTIPQIEVVMNYVTWFIILYFIASYIRLYSNTFFNNTKLWAIYTCIFLFISIFSIIICSWISVRTGQQLAYYFLADCNKILAVLTALSAFLFFKNWKIKNSKFINTVAASTFGILTIHTNSNTMRQWLWNDLLNNTKYYNSKWLPLHALFSIFSVYIVCAIIDFFRNRYIEHPILTIVNSHINKKTL